MLSREAAAQGVTITGGTGSGKSTAQQFFAKALQEEIWFSIGTVKPNETAQYQKRLTNPLLITDVVWNKYTESMLHDGGNADNLVAFKSDLKEVLTRSDSSKAETFWRGGEDRTLKHAFELVWHVKGIDSTYEDVYQVLMDAPSSIEAANSMGPDNRCAWFLRQLMNKDEKLGLRYRDFFCKTFAGIGDKANGAWRGGALGGIEPFVSGPIGRLVNGRSTISTKELITRHVIWNTDILTYGKPGLAIQLLLSWSCMDEALRRTGDFGYWGLIRDEYHQFAHRRDIPAVAMGRSQKLISCVAYQSIPTLEDALGGGVDAQTQAKALFGLYRHRFFLNNACHITNEMQSEAIGKERVMFYSGSSNLNQELPWWDFFGVGRSPNVSFGEQWHYKFPPSDFMKLRTGGPENQFLVDAIYHNGYGHQLITINQKEVI